MEYYILQLRFPPLSRRHPVPFTAHLAAGSDPELSVHPTSGELAPINTRGTLFCVTYKPTTYGRDHHARLIVQVCVIMHMLYVIDIAWQSVLYGLYSTKPDVCNPVGEGLCKPHSTQMPCY